MTEEFKKLKEDTKKQPNELKETEFKENKCQPFNPRTTLLQTFNFTQHIRLQGKVHCICTYDFIYLKYFDNFSNYSFWSFRK